LILLARQAALKDRFTSFSPPKSRLPSPVLFSRANSSFTLRVIGIERGRFVFALIARTVIAFARRAAWLLVREGEKLEGEEKTFVETLVKLSPEIAETQSLAKEFNRILKQRDHDAFPNWMERATQIGIPKMKKFALGLERDRSAVVAALEYKWSNGPTEGHINRLKTLKRAMYGRAKFDLLRIKVLAGSKRGAG
jgi:hypothetical protein